jgi:membrane-associated phospholipid phosphatase
VLIALATAHWRLKLWLLVLINGLFWIGYTLLGHHAFFPLWVIPETALDRWVPFQPEGWAWVYLSQFVFVGVLPWLLATREAIHRYGRGILLMALLSFGCFLFFPSRGPRPVEVGASTAMQMIAAYDGHLNACPSLHAAFLAYMALLAWRMFGRVAPWGTVLTAGAWGLAILYSTLATKQHYALDLAAGLVVGMLADWLAWRNAPHSTDK